MASRKSAPSVGWNGRRLPRQTVAGLFWRKRFGTDPCDMMEALPLTILWKVLVRVFL